MIKADSDVSRVWFPHDLGVEVWAGNWRTRGNVPHTHDCYQFHLTRRNSGTFTFRDTRCLLTNGCVIAVQPGEIHSAKPKTGRGWEFETFYVPVEAMLEAAASLTERFEPLPFFPHNVIKNAALAQLFHGLHHALTRPSLRLEREALYQQLLTTFLLSHAEQPLTPRIPRREHGAVRLVREYLEENPADNISLATLSQLAGLNAFYLSRVFKRETGLPPHAYQIRSRVGRATKLLREGRTVAEIVVDLGFADQSHLIRHFKRHIGMTPQEYQRQAKPV